MRDGNMTDLYYAAPSDEAFDEMKEKAIEIWSKYGEPYKSEKLARIKDIKNISDNFMYMFAMFDMDNQAAVVLKLSEPTKKALRERLVDGGNDRFYLLAIGL